MRGERFLENRFSIAPNGSSPYARGTRSSGVGSRPRLRFIPACAGNAKMKVGSAWNAAGSSPHARGTLDDTVVEAAGDRFIPACAGNAPVFPRCRSMRTVHPRMRGERNDSTRFRLVTFGSSPHARGTLAEEFSHPLADRFIPACAGNASTRHPAAHARPVHPRMRGERRQSVGLRGADGGSSPHARGTLRSVSLEGRAARFIPACAGNAARSAGGPVPWAVHPRMRGERYLSMLSGTVVYGSSPHARGTLCHSIGG